MRITLNGKPADAPDNELVHDLLERLGLGGPVAVQVNEEIIPRDRLPDTRLKPGDKVELLRMMGGG